MYVLRNRRNISWGSAGLEEGPSIDHYEPTDIFHGGYADAMDKPERPLRHIRGICSNPSFSNLPFFSNRQELYIFIKKRETG